MGNNVVVNRNTPQPYQLYGFPWGKVYKSSLWQLVQFPEIYWFEDTVGGLVLYDMAKKKASIPSVVYEYRRNSAGISASSRGKVKTIDTLWITFRLLADRATLGLPFDEAFCEKFFKQCKMNASRIHSLGSRKADWANFQASRHLYEKYFGQVDATELLRHDKIGRAIAANDFRSFMLAVLLT